MAFEYVFSLLQRFTRIFSAKQTPSSPSLSTLPLELISCILESLDDVRSLPAVVLSSRVFYDAYTVNKFVTAKVLKNQITPALLPYALAVHQSTLQAATAESSKDLLDDLYEDRSEFLDSFSNVSWPVAMQIVRMHKLVQWFAAEFVESALSLFPGLSASERQISRNEHFRICRALYRAELYFNLLRWTSPTRQDRSLPHQSTLLSRDDQNDYFFDRHSSLVNEQLACIYDFLEQKLDEEGFLEVAKHDVEFGEYSVDYVNRGNDNPNKPTYLSQGLQFLRRLEMASTFDEKTKILSERMAAPHANLAEGLSDANYGFDESENEDLLLLARQEGDFAPGPVSIWDWASRDFDRPLVFFDDHSSLRLRGYVMWDEDRLVKCKMREEFEPLPAIRTPYPREEIEAMHASHEARSQIWRRGGTGYWSESDKSRIVWPHGTPR